MFKELLARLQRRLRDHGWRATIRDCIREVWLRIRAWNKIGRRPIFSDHRELLDYLYAPDMKLIRPSQIRGELESFLSELNGEAPQVVMEIGTNNGGTLFLWTRLAAPDALIISLDLPGGEFGGGYGWWRTSLYRDFALSGQTLHLLRRDSHAPASLKAVQDLLGGRLLDVLFIDGDHTYEGVRMDHEMYRSLVRPGGWIVFHDIAEHVDPGCDVRRYWLEVSRGCRAVEHVAIPPAGWAGLGVIRPS